MAFKNLAKFVSYEEKDIGRGFIVIKVSYTSPTYQDPAKVFTVGKPEKDISEDLLEKIVALVPGQDFCIHTEKDSKGFSVLADITDKKDAEKPAQGKAVYKKATGGSTWQPKDETGIAVGAAFANALELTKMRGYENEMNIDDISDLAEEILYKKLELEDKLRAKKAAKDAVGVKKVVEAPVVLKKKSKIAELRERKAKINDPEVSELTDDDFAIDDDED